MSFLGDIARQTRDWLVPERLSVKQRAYPYEPLYSWLYRYVLFRVHLLVFLVYTAFLGRNLMTCDSNSVLERSFIEAICLHNYTFVIRDPVLDGQEKQGAFSSSFRDALKQHGPTGTREYLYYNRFIVIILLVLALIHVFPQLVFRYLDTYRRQHFTCTHLTCTSRPLEHFKCLSTQMNYLLSVTKHRTILLTNYLLSDYPPLLSIVLSFLWLNFTFTDRFLPLGVNILNYYVLKVEGTREPLRYMFPILSKCTISYITASGELKQMDSFCTLKFNYANQAVFAFLWFAYLFIFASYLAGAVWKLQLLTTPAIRSDHIASLFKRRNLNFTLQISAPEYIVLQNVCRFTARYMGSTLALALNQRPFHEWIQLADSQVEAFPLTDTEIERLLKEAKWPL